jgi:hypothetical protein
MTTTEQRMQRLIDELSRDARSDEDKARAESMRKHWAEVQDQRLRDELHILLLLETHRYEDEQFEAALDDGGGDVIAKAQR